MENGGETTFQPSPLNLQEKSLANNPNQADIPTPRKKAYEYPHVRPGLPAVVYIFSTPYLCFRHTHSQLKVVLPIHEDTRM